MERHRRRGPRRPGRRHSGAGGAVNLPIIKFSVDWWSTLHQGESIIAGKIAPVYLWPLLLMMLGYGLLFLIFGPSASAPIS